MMLFIILDVERLANLFGSLLLDHVCQSSDMSNPAALNAKIICCQDEIKTVGSGPPSCARCPNS